MYFVWFNPHHNLEGNRLTGMKSLTKNTQLINGMPGFPPDAVCPEGTAPRCLSVSVYLQVTRSLASLRTFRVPGSMVGGDTDPVHRYKPQEG